MESDKGGDRNDVERFLNQHKQQDMIALYKNLNLHEKVLLLKLLVTNDVIIFDQEKSGLHDGSDIAQISLNGVSIQLTIRLDGEFI